MRALTEVSDVRAVPFLADVFDGGSGRLREQAGIALNFAALAAVERPYLLGRLVGAPAPSLDDLAGSVEPARARRWLGERHRRFEVGAFAGWVLASTGDREAIPLYELTLLPETTDAYLRVVAAYALVRAGRDERICTLVDLLGESKHEYQESIPSLLIELAPRYPDVLAGCLRRGLADERRRAREMSAWVAGASGMTGVTPALETALADPDRRVRIAAAWATGRLRDAGARAALARLARDDDPETRDFAADALARLDTP